MNQERCRLLCLSPSIRAGTVQAFGDVGAVAGKHLFVGRKCMCNTGSVWTAGNSRGSGWMSDRLLVEYRSLPPQKRKISLKSTLFFFAMQCSLETLMCFTIQKFTNKLKKVIVLTYLSAWLLVQHHSWHFLLKCSRVTELEFGLWAVGVFYASRTMMEEWLHSCPAPSLHMCRRVWDQEKSTQLTWWHWGIRVEVSQ